MNDDQFANLLDLWQPVSEWHEDLEPFDDYLDRLADELREFIAWPVRA